MKKIREILRGYEILKLIRIIRNYWLAEETNIFKNYKDALCGFVVLILIPALSVGSAIFATKYTFWNYTFPLLSISLAGLYDTYGRYEGDSPKNPKLAIRIIFNCISIFFAALSVGIKNNIPPYFSPILLLICGIFLIFEIYNRVRKAVLISRWGIYI